MIRERAAKFLSFWFACTVCSTASGGGSIECRCDPAFCACACSPEQKAVAEAYIKEIQPRYESPIVTEVVHAPKFWPAEDYHQRYVGSSLPPSNARGSRCNAGYG